MKLLEKIRLPETKDIDDLDAPSTTILHSRIIQKKYFLKKIYEEFYRIFMDALPALTPPLNIIEIGSGGGFIKTVIPHAITSDIIDIPDIDLRFSATHMPLKSNGADALLMFDVFHHISHPLLFLEEVQRCLRIGGKLVMIEPASTLFSRFIYKHFHREPFNPQAGWELKSTGPLTSANVALPWIVFFRDREIFSQRFPHLHIQSLREHTPFRYLLSGGLSFRQLLPDCFYPFVTGLENGSTTFLMGKKDLVD